MIEKNFILTNIEGDQAILTEINTNKKIFWPLKYLSENIKIDEPVSIAISSEEDMVNRKILAKDVLNEILDISE